MGKKNKYYLIARNIHNNKFNIIDFDGKLESIDLYTTDFSSSKDLIEDLYDKKAISSKDVDLYIVSSKKNGNQTYLVTNEVLYYNSRCIRFIAHDSLCDRLGVDNANVSELLYRFCVRMTRDSSFYDMVVYGNTDLYPKFTDYFIGKRFHKSYEIKYRDGAWVNKSYPLLRNICESFEKVNNQDEIDECYANRKVIESSLLFKLDDKAFGDQMSLYDVEEFAKYNLSKQDKMMEVLSVFECVNKDDFERENESIKFKDNDKYKNDIDKLKSLLDYDLSMNLFLYLTHKSNLIDSDSSSSYKANKKLMDESLRNITRLLYSDDKILNNAYEWSLLYVKNNSLIYGDENGYQKRKDGSRG